MEQKELDVRLMLIGRIVLLQVVLLICGLAYLFFALKASLGGFWFGFMAGIFGASIHLLRRVTSKKVALPYYLLNKSWTVTICPFLYGGLMAAIVYFLLIAGLLSGEGGGGLVTTNLFPNFSFPGDGSPFRGMMRFLSPNEPIPLLQDFLNARPANVPDFAKLLTWCFLGGYSESFVTGVLNNLQSRVNSEQVTD